MAVRIRLARGGRRHLPHYQIVIHDKDQPPQSRRCVDRIGEYHPANADESTQIRVDTEKAVDWLSRGATPSETVASLLKKAGVEIPEPARKPAKRQSKGQKPGRKVKERTKKRTANSKARKAKKQES